MRVWVPEKYPCLKYHIWVSVLLRFGVYCGCGSGDLCVCFCLFGSCHGARLTRSSSLPYWGLGFVLQFTIASFFRHHRRRCHCGAGLSSNNDTRHLDVNRAGASLGPRGRPAQACACARARAGSTPPAAGPGGKFCVAPHTCRRLSVAVLIRVLLLLMILRMQREGLTAVPQRREEADGRTNGSSCANSILGPRRDRQVCSTCPLCGAHDAQRERRRPRNGMQLEPQRHRHNYTRRCNHAQCEWLRRSRCTPRRALGMQLYPSIV